VRPQGHLCHLAVVKADMFCVSACRCSTFRHIRMDAESFSESWSTVCLSRRLACWRRCMSTQSDCCTTSTVTTLYNMCWNMAGQRIVAALWRRSVAKFSH